MNVSYSLFLFVILSGSCNSVFAQHEPKTTTTEMDLSFPNCGIQIPKIQGKSRQSSTPTREMSDITPVIVGGREADLNTWPWMVAIFKKTNSRTPKRFLCGASIISQRYVLTAAHCFKFEKGNIDPNKFSVVVGSSTLTDGTEYAVKKILIHPDYKPPQYYNDISLLEIKNKIELSKKVYPVCLPSDGQSDKILTNNPNVTVTGWGQTSYGGVGSKNLVELTIPIVPLNECNAAYSKTSHLPKGITKLFLCAGVKEGGKDSCQGDSGGPLVLRLKDNSYVQLGVVSFGFRCALAGTPGVYTRVSKYTQWLYENTDLGKV